MTSINTDKSKQSSEADELREMNELKERKIVALQRKVRVLANLNLISEIYFQGVPNIIVGQNRKLFFLCSYQIRQPLLYVR